MRVRIAASAPPMVMAGRTRWAKLPEPETGSHPSLMRKSRIRIGPRAKFGNDKPEEADYAEQAVIPAIAALRGTNSGRNRQQNSNQQGGKRELQRVGVALRDQCADALVEAERRAQISVENALPVMEVLLSQRLIESVGVACGLDVGRRGAFSEHLQNGIAGNEMNQQKDQRDHEPDDWQRVQHAKRDVAKHRY